MAPSADDGDPERDRPGADDQLPVDSDIDDIAADRDRPTHLRPAFVLVVGLGGAFGTLTRALLTDLGGTRFGLSSGSATMIINIAGCLLLGGLLELLVRLGPDHGRRRMLRLLLGTGFLGGFTTYSTLALVVAEQLRSGAWVGGVGYGLGSLLLGLVACAVGIALASLRRHHAAGEPGR